MSILGVVVILLIIGVLLALLDRVPMDGTFRWIIRAVVILVVVIWLLNMFAPSLGLTRPIGRLP